MQNYMTRSTYERMIKELEKIKNIEIPKISREKLEAARQGDLSENAEYEAAKEKLELLHIRFSNMQSRLSHPVFIEDLNIPGTIVSIGTVVSLLDKDTRETSTYTILGTEDSDVEQNIISFRSPIAKGIIGKKIGDECEILLPESSRNVVIESIKVFKRESRNCSG